MSIGGYSPYSSPYAASPYAAMPQQSASYNPYASLYAAPQQTMAYDPYAAAASMYGIPQQQSGYDPYGAALASMYGSPQQYGAPQQSYDPYAAAASMYGMPQQQAAYSPYGAYGAPQQQQYSPYGAMPQQQQQYSPYGAMPQQQSGGYVDPLYSSLQAPGGTMPGSSYGIPAYNMPSSQGPFMGSLGGMSPQSQYVGDLLGMNTGRVDPNFGLIPAASSNFLGTTLALGGAQSLPFSIARGTSSANLPPLLSGLPVFDVKHYLDGQYQSPMLANPLMSSQVNNTNPLVPYFSPQGQTNYFNQGYPSYNGYPGFSM